MKDVFCDGYLCVILWLVGVCVNSEMLICIVCLN